ncbi:MAG: polysaccharide biosynthesis C-terminal domain-containing protein [Oscillospiraceae bacterium]
MKNTVSKKQGFLSGSLILIASAAVSKVIGAIFRIPLANMLGGEGMGYFSSAYGIFMTVYAVSVTGLPVAASKLTAERFANADKNGAANVRSTALALCALCGLAFTLLTLLLAYPFCAFLSKSPLSVIAVAAIAPSVLFSCITAVFRGCAEGRRNMYPTAVSQVIEASVKLFAGLVLCYAVLNAPSSFFEASETTIKKLLPFKAIQSVTADGLVMPLAAAAAVFGVTVSSLAGLIYMAIRSAFDKDEKLRSKPSRATASELTAIIIPVALGSLITNLTSLIDLATIISCLKKAVAAAPQLFSASDISYEALPNFIFGSFSGLAVTVFNLIPSFTNMFGKGAVPFVAEGFARKDNNLVRQSAMRVIFTAGFIAVPSGIGISTLAPQILELLFPSRRLETMAAVDSLRVLGFGVIFLSVSSVLFAVMQAAGRGDIPVKIMAAGVAVKLLLNLVLIPIPEINVVGAALSTDVCYMLIMLLSIKSVSKLAKTPQSKIYSLLFKLFFCGMICAAAAVLAQNLLQNLWKTPLTLFISVPIGAIFYIISTHLTGILTKTTLKMLIC